MPVSTIVRRTVLLSRLLLSGSQSFASSESKAAEAPWKKTLRIVGYAFLVLYLMAIAAFMIYGSTAAMAPLGLVSLMPPVLITLYGLLVVFMGFYYVVSVFYYSSDSETLLSLPFRPVEIAGARFIQSYIYIFLIGSVFFLPAFIAFGAASGQSWSFYLMIPFLLVFLPVIPLGIITAIVMILMRFAPFARNKDRFAMVMNLLIMALVLSVSFFLSTPTSEEELVEIILGGADGSRLRSISRLNLLFPGIRFAGDAVNHVDSAAGWGWLGLFTLASLLIGALTMVLATALYGQTIVNFSQGGQKHRRIEAQELQRESRSSSLLMALVRKEMRILIRTPMFFLNNVLSSLLIPVFLLLTPIMSGGLLSMDRSGFGDMFGSWSSVMLNSGQEGGTMLDSGTAVLIALTAAAALALALGAMNSITATALSREGSNAYLMKFIPVSYQTQMLAKVIPALVLALVGILPILAAAVWFFRLPVSLTLFMLAYVLLGTIISNLLGLVFDLIRPKLKWDNETQAVKNNLNVLWAMLLGMLLAGLVVLAAFGAYQLKLSALVFAFALLALLLLLTLAVSLWLRRWIPGRMKVLEL